ncbi:MAG: SGNH/GDSL hydrolase family protein [Candidatus Hydrogenedentales bacterium]
MNTVKAFTFLTATILTFAGFGCATASKGGKASPPPALERLDAAKATADAEKKLNWFDARLLGIEGQGWTDVESPYDRLPSRAKGVVRDPVWSLSKDSAGLCVRFVTDSPNVWVRWKLNSANLAMDHMPATGVSGVDLYARDGAAWKWVGIGRTKGSDLNQEAQVVNTAPAGQHEFVLYLPLYNGVESAAIGVNADAFLAKAAARPAAKSKPVVVYGTSITQGGCASRPGMVYTSILSRRMGYPFINLGFSGNGPMEAELVTFMTEIDAAAYVLDCLPNMNTANVKERVEPAVKILREKRPDTPIIFVEDITRSGVWFYAERQTTLDEKNAALRAAYDKLVAHGVKGLYYVQGEKLLGDTTESTVDGTHPTDVGFISYADAVEPVLRRALW